MELKAVYYILEGQDDLGFRVSVSSIVLEIRTQCHLVVACDVHRVPKKGRHQTHGCNSVIS